MSPAYIRLVPRSDILARYFYVQYFDLYLRGVFNQLGTGVRATLGPYDLLNLPLAVPPREEQGQIVRFFGALESRIRRFTHAKRRLIELLNEQKQAIIHRAVTRGLDPNVRLKPSGIDWLGDVPQHWEVVRLKHLFREIDDRSEAGDETLLSLRMYQGLVPHTAVSDKPITSDDLVGFKRTKPDEVVMNRMRASSGMFALATMAGIVSPDYAVFRQITDIMPEYYVHLFKTRLMRAVFRVESKGLGTGSAGFLRLYTDRFGAIRVPRPPTQEQAAILSHIQDATRGLVIAQERITREVSHVAEYRARLIADIVTGKLDVRSVELPARDEDEVLEEWNADDEAEAEEMTDIAEATDAYV